MKIYTYDRKGIFIDQTKAKKDPLENERRKKLYQAELAIISRMEGLDDSEKAGLIAKLKTPKDAFLVPVNATEKKPPTLAKNEVACFGNGKWSKLKDHRGQIFHMPGEREEFIMEVFGNVPEGAVLGKRTIGSDEKWEVVRANRDRLLSESDWMMLSDAPVDNIKAEAYRQKLRDIPNDFTDPEKVVFPELG